MACDTLEPEHCCKLGTWSYVDLCLVQRLQEAFTQLYSSDRIRVWSLLLHGQNFTLQRAIAQGPPTSDVLCNAFDCLVQLVKAPITKYASGKNHGWQIKRKRSISSYRSTFWRVFDRPYTGISNKKERKKHPSFAMIARSHIFEGTLTRRLRR